MNHSSSSNSSIDDGIAIVGMAGRFPGAKTVEAFWRNLCAGKESITRFEEGELEDWFDDEVRRAPNYVKARPILEEVDLFDAEFFGMHARETQLTDPQHRIFLECVWEALEDGGYDPAAYEGAIGVFAGCSMNTYFLNNVCRDRQTIEAFTSSYQVGCYPELVGASQDFLSTRVSYKLDLKGPSLTLQTACSTSLLAVAEACQSLQLYQSDMALAGGVSITFPQKRGYLHQPGGMVSADGSCRPFDARATGTIFGSGAGVVLLKRLPEALADGDQIYAVIRGWGVTNDGSSKVGFTAPSVDGQAAAIERALAGAGIDARRISYIECHGTATPLGDPIEIAGLAKAFSASTEDRQFCAIGSVKGNIGHLDAAAGVAGLIKTALALKHRRLPASLHFEHANPEIDFAATPFYVNASLAEWPVEPTPRCAGVSSFGVGGTNVHVVLEEPAEPKVPLSIRDDESRLIVLSGRSEPALAQARNRLAAHLREHGEQSFGDIAYTLQTGRRAFEHRCAIVCQDRNDAIAKLEKRDTPQSHIGRVHRPGSPVVFMFPGQGTQYPDMGRDLYEMEPEFRRQVDHCAEILKPRIGVDLRDLLYPREDASGVARQLQCTAFAQPAIFTVEYALAQLWMSWGVRPSAMIGHSVGEFVAAVLAGVLSLPDALAVIGERGRLIQALPGGAMLAVRLPAEEIEPLLNPMLSVAAINAPSLCVISGSDPAVDALEKRLAAQNVIARRLFTSHAFHSPMMDPIIEPLRQCLEQVELAPPSVPYVSTVTGDWIRAEDATSPDYWARHAREPVRFRQGIECLESAAWPILLEVGPGNALTTIALQARRGMPGLALSCLPDAERQTPDRNAMLEALGRLWIAGVTPDWTAVNRGRGSRISLPTYAFQRSRHWIEQPARMTAPQQTEGQSAGPATRDERPMDHTAATEPVLPPGLDSGDDRVQSIQTTIIGILEDLSGEPISKEVLPASFLEMGFDSLFLSQVCQRIQSQLKVRVAFRQLLGDYSTIATLAGFLNEQTRHAVASKSASSQASSATALSIVASASPVQQQPVDQPSIEEAAPPSRFDVYKPRQASAGELTPEQRQHVDSLIARYTARTAGSKKRTQTFRPVLADPRAVAGFRAEWKEMVYPIVCARSHGSRLWDVDGNEYVDLVNGYGQTAFGHAPDFVVDAIKTQLDKGFAIGPQTELAGEVATLIAEFTGNERVTFCNTGSEAVMAALRVARTVTGRSKVVMFNGAYHGQFDEVLAKGLTRPGRPLRTMPVAAGIPESAVGNMVVLEYATPAALQWVADNAADLAAVVVEPVQSRHPDLQPFEFLRRLREITEASETAFIMDEVVTGFRVHLGGMQAVSGIRADMATYGKVVGGGLPIGILAGKAKFMDALDGGMWDYGDDSAPSVGVTFFAGTFVRHPLTLAATLAVLKHLKENGRVLYQEVSGRTASAVAELNRLFQQYGLAARVQNYSSFFYFDLSHEHPLARLLYFHLRARGVHIQDGFPCFLTTAHSEADIQRILHAFRESLDELRALGIFAAGQEKRETVQIDATASASPNESAALVSLTESQIEIWLAAQLSDEASCAFNESVTLRLNGRLDEAAFKTALDRVLARHDALRTFFEPTGEAMRIAKSSSFSYASSDLSAQPDAESALRTLIDADARTPFDLINGPLVRGHLVRLSPTAHAFILTAHHIICDGWSINVILRELAEIYAARAQGISCSLPEPLSFSTHAQLQRARPAEDTAETEAFWLRQFEQPVQPLELPVDRLRGAIKSFRGASRSRRIEASLYEAVKEAGARQGCTLFVTLLAAFQLLMGRLADQDDVVVGVPTAGQSLLEDEILVGHCVNFLPIRAGWTSETRLCDYLKAARERVLDAYDNQNYTLGTLVRKLGHAREHSRMPLTEVQFNLERLADRLRLPDLEITVEPNAKAHVNFDLFLNIIESAEGLRLDCDYNTDLWDAATIDRWLDYYRVLLEAIVTDASIPVARVSYVPAAERHKLLVEPNETASDYPRNASVHSLFEQQALARPGSVAVVFGKDFLSYEALDRRANRLARHLRAQGAGPGKRIGVLMQRSLDMLVALLAVMKTGSAYVPLDPLHPAARLRRILGEAGLAALVTDDVENAALAPTEAAVIDLAKDASAIAAQSESPLPIAIPSESVAYVIYTSGSTGSPKGVEVTHRSLVNLLSSMAREPSLGPDDVLVAVTTISFDIAALELFLPLCVGAGTVIATREESADGHRLSELITTSGATMMQATPATWRMLVEAEFHGGPGFRMLCGGEALPRDLANELLRSGGELWNMYGPTETTVWSSCGQVRAGDDPITIGRPIANTQLYILDRGDQPVPIGQIGQLHIGGEGVARGYLNHPELTAEKFLPNPFHLGRMYRTGDLARRMPGGEIQILGRMDHQVKLRGFRIELGEIEAALSAKAGLTAAVMLREDMPTGPQLVAYYAGTSDAAQSPAALRSLLADELPDYMIPTTWMRLEKLPVSPNGKIDRAALPVPDVAHPDSEEFHAPRTPMQTTLAGIFGDVLGLERVGMRDDLLALGADSIHLFQITARANRNGIRLSAKQLIQHRTIETLSGHLAEAGANASSDVAPRVSSILSKFKLPESPVRLETSV
ncbi:MAG: hypothetical protein QOK29_3592 [Rhodospirillaceae bacterium]|nr:hypothetical protein [Rhodospirillaceae bacterium]